MQYFIYKITAGPTSLVKTLDMLEEHASFKAAKQSARDLRAELDESAGESIKIIFAENQLDAEEKLMIKREAPILREWEK